MKIAVSGKGGVGKTTFSALLIRTLNAEGRHVLAIDADPDANLSAPGPSRAPSAVFSASTPKWMIFPTLYRPAWKTSS